MAHSQIDPLPPGPKERSEFFILSFLLTLLMFRIFVGFYSFTGVGHHDEYSLYFWGLMVFVPSGVLAGIFFERVRRRWPLLRRSLYLSLILADFLLLLFFYAPGGWTSGQGIAQLFFFLIFQAAGILLGIILGRNTDRLLRIEGILYLLMGVLGVIWLAFVSKAFETFWNNGVYSFGFMGAVILFFYQAIPGVPGLRIPAVRKKKDGWEKKVFLIALAALLISVAVFDPRFDFNRHHASFYLGPLADLSAGKSLLVNINAQYGVLVFYFLSLFFHILPLGFVSFTLVYTFLLIAQYLLVFLIARGLLGSWLWAFFILGAFLLLNYFAPDEFVLGYPSTGPLRFGLFYVLVGLVLARNRYPGKTQAILWVESLMAAAAFFWGLEVCLFTIPAYAGLSLYECLERRGKFRLDLKMLMERAGCFFACVLPMGVLIYLDIFLRSGRWPDWSLYFDLVFTYGGGFGKVDLPPAGYWWLAIGILLVSLFAIFGVLSGKKVKVAEPPNFNAVVLLTLGGFFQFFYFFNRPANSNLAHICLPDLMLSIYWLHFLRRTDANVFPRALKRVGFALSAIFIGLYLQALLPRVIQKMSLKSLPLPVALEKIRQAFRDEPRDEAFASTAEELFQKYSGSQKFLVYFFGQRGLEVSLYKGRSKLYPYNDVVQAGFSPPVLDRIMKFDPRLKPGDHIYLSRDFVSYSKNFFENYGNFEPMLFQKISEGYDLKQVDLKGGIYVFRIEGQKPGSHKAR